MSTVSHRPDSFYSSFVQRLSLSATGIASESEVEQLLNGAAADEAYTKIPRSIRSGDGIFFSGHTLSAQAATLAETSISNGAKIFDPACGAGDLLIGAARLLPLEKTFENTLDIWGGRIGGSDLHQSFIDATKWRLVLLAKHRHGIAGEAANFNIEQLFPFLTKNDYLLNPTVSDGFECLLTNPPFGHRQAPEGCQWSRGKTQLAAIFMEKVIENRKPGDITIAILPDVLRGGSRYGRWRDWIGKNTKVTATQVYGRFEKRTDVDVFLCRFEQSQSLLPQLSPEIEEQSTNQTVGKLFNVRVGPVVPHRHLELGPLRPYLTVSNSPANSETYVTSHRKFSGSVVTPPFVAIRRTSNPADARRVVCTVILGNEAVAVENHLIIATPHSQRIEDCRKLAQTLSSETTTEHINSALRCRHLTTGLINSIPILDWK